MILSHDPAIAYGYENDIIVSGHVHNLYRKYGNSFNVGVDVNNFEPVHIDVVYNEIDEFLTWKEKELKNASNINECET